MTDLLRDNMDPWLVIAKDTVAKDINEDDLWQCTKCAFEQLGLAKPKSPLNPFFSSGSWDQIASPFEQHYPHSGDSAMFRAATKNNRRLNKTRSLRLILRKLLAARGGLLKDMAVFALASQRLTHIRQESVYGPIWTAKLGLFDVLELRKWPMSGLTDAYRCVPIQLDGKLDQVFKQFEESSAAMFGRKDWKVNPVATLPVLLELELQGLAVPYWEDGEIAWRSAGEFGPLASVGTQVGSDLVPT